MSDQLIRTQLEKTGGLKSLKDLMRVKLSERVFLLIDCSGSMNEYMRNGKKRIDGLRTVVEQVQSQKPTTMIAFGPRNADHIDVFFTTTVPDPDGGTPLHRAIELARTNGAGRLLVISDGIPDLSQQCLEEAKSFGGPIDVVYVGDPDDPTQAWTESRPAVQFMDELAKVTGGSKFDGDLSQPKALAGAVIGLLSGEVLVDDDDEDAEDDNESADEDNDEDNDEEDDQ